MSASVSAPMQALKDFKETLRTPIQDVDSFTFLLSSTLQNLDIHPTSVPPSDVSGHIKAIDRLLPWIQESLLEAAAPTFIPALDQSGLDILQRFFVPPRTADRGSLAIFRAIALCSYSTFASLFSTNSKAEKKVEVPVPVRNYVLSLVLVLVSTYNVDELYWGVWGSSAAMEPESSKNASMRTLKWEEAVRHLVSLPAKVANTVGKWNGDGWPGDIPETLTPKSFFDRLVVRLESVMYETSQTKFSDKSRLRVVLQRLISLGLCNRPPDISISPAPSLWTTMLPRLLSHLHPTNTSLPSFPEVYLPSLFLSLPTSGITPLIHSLLEHLVDHLDFQSALDPSKPDERVKRASMVLTQLIGRPMPDGEAYEAVMRSILDSKSKSIRNRKASSVVRLAAAWISTGVEQTRKFFVENILDAWTDPKYVKYALYSQQHTLTYALILGISLFRPYNPFLISLSHKVRFLTAMQSYLAHPDPSIRRLGMLVAEVISERTIREEGGALDEDADEIEELKRGLEGDAEERSKPKPPKGQKRLNFGEKMWAGEGEGKAEARWLRSSVGLQDVTAELSDDDSLWMLGWPLDGKSDRANDQQIVVGASAVSPQPTKKSKPETEKISRPKIVMLDDEQSSDPLVGYFGDSPSSSRSPSPTLSHLEEIAADPSLAIGAVGQKKAQRPVYISQLIVLLKEKDKPDHLEMGLKWGESLIRAKRSFGGELEENAPTLASAVVALNDAYNLEDFDDLRQGILNALVACSPKNVAPYLCETYFIGQFSLQQRSVMLTAIAMGARELAGLSVPEPPKTRKIDFPSKVLPPHLHRKYITPSDVPQNGQIEDAIDGIRGLLLSKSARKGEELVPELAREKRLRMSTTKKTKAAEIGTLAERQMAQTKAPAPVIDFNLIAAEYFIMPLINHFWQFFQESTIRENRAMMSGTRYRGAGVGLILSPMALEKFLMTLALLLHASRHCSLFLAVLAPEAIELAVTIGARHPGDAQVNFGGEEKQQGKGQEASVIGASLEIALVALDASYELDQGRTMALDKTALLMACGEWANGVFSAEEENGNIAAGQGGLREGRVRAAAAGVVVKVSEIGERWSRFSQ